MNRSSERRRFKKKIFSCEFWKILKNIYFEEYLRKAASDCNSTQHNNALMKDTKSYLNLISSKQVAWINTLYKPMQASVFLTKERARHCLINTARYHDYYRINVKNQPTSTLIEIIQLFGIFPANICLFKVHNRNTRKRCEICLKLTIKTP